MTLSPLGGELEGVLQQKEVFFVGPLPVRPRRGKVVLVLGLGAVRSNSENCPNIHFLRFTDPHEIQIPKAHDAYYPMTPP